MSYIPTHVTWPELLPESVYRELELLGRLDRYGLLLDACKLPPLMPVESCNLRRFEIPRNSATS
ncbi:MAG: hypothetical protein R6W92_09460 [Desulfocurvibacter africanus]